MAVYVDGMRARYGRMIMCHMIADSRKELDEMADAIGVRRKWRQKTGTIYEHYDVSLSARHRAIDGGAIYITTRELVKKIAERKNPAVWTAYVKDAE